MKLQNVFIFAGSFIFPIFVFKCLCNLDLFSYVYLVSNFGTLRIICKYCYMESQYVK